VETVEDYQQVKEALEMEPENDNSN
jgi:hypothetical protein